MEDFYGVNRETIVCKLLYFSQSLRFFRTKLDDAVESLVFKSNYRHTFQEEPFMIPNTKSMNRIRYYHNKVLIGGKNWRHGCKFPRKLIYILHVISVITSEKTFFTSRLEAALLANFFTSCHEIHKKFKLILLFLLSFLVILL